MVLPLSRLSAVLSKRTELIVVELDTFSTTRMALNCWTSITHSTSTWPHVQMNLSAVWTHCFRRVRIWDLKMDTNKRFLQLVHSGGFFKFNQVARTVIRHTSSHNCVCSHCVHAKNRHIYISTYQPKWPDPWMNDGRCVGHLAGDRVFAVRKRMYHRNRWIWSLEIAIQAWF